MALQSNTLMDPQIHEATQEMTEHPHREEFVLDESYSGTTPVQDEYFLWGRVLDLIKLEKKNRRKVIKGRLSRLCVLHLPKFGAFIRILVRHSLKRRRSIPIGSCWAGKGACLQDFYHI